MTNVAWLQSHEFIVGAVVGVIVLSALGVASQFRDVALALAASGIVALYVQGGIPNLLAISRTLEKELRANADFSYGILIGLAIGAIVVLSMRRRFSS